MATKRTKDVPLTPEQLQLEKDVKRINERINEIAKMYGTESEAYNKWYSAIKTTVPERYRKMSKHGIIQIARSKEFYQSAGSESTKNTISRLLGLKTRGQLRKEAKKSLQEEGVIKPSVSQIAQRQKDIDRVQAFVADHSDMFYNESAKDIAKIRGRKKTYGELLEIIRRYNEATGSGKIININLFEDLE